MKKIFTPAYLFFLLLAISSCKTEKIEESLAYSFSDVFVGYKQPAITPSNVVLTDVTLAKVNESKSNKEALTAISNNLALPSSMEKSISNLLGSINANVFAELGSSFNASEMAALANGQPLSASVRKNIDMILNSGYVDSFKSEIVMPTLDGKLAENFKITKTEYVATLGLPKGSAPKPPKDKCNEDADNAYNANKQNVDLDKVNAEKTVLKSYELAEEKAKKQFDKDKETTKSTFKADREKATNDFNKAKAQINDNKKLSQAQKNAAIAVQIALLNDQMAKLIAAEKAQEIADSLKKDSDIAKASKARDTDLEKINVKYTIEMDKLESLSRVAKNKCHNQGGGNNGNGNGNGGGNGTGNEGGGNGPG